MFCCVMLTFHGLALKYFFYLLTETWQVQIPKVKTTVKIFLVEVPKPEGRIGCYGNGLIDAKEKPKI